MDRLALHIPTENELEYRRHLISDEETMTYNQAMATMETVAIIRLLIKFSSGIKTGTTVRIIITLISLETMTIFRSAKLTFITAIIAKSISSVL